MAPRILDGHPQREGKGTHFLTAAYKTVIVLTWVRQLWPLIDAIASSLRRLHRLTLKFDAFGFPEWIPFPEEPKPVDASLARVNYDLCRAIWGHIQYYAAGDLRGLHFNLKDVTVLVGSPVRKDSSSRIQAAHEEQRTYSIQTSMTDSGQPSCRVLCVEAEEARHFPDADPFRMHRDLEQLANDGALKIRIIRVPITINWATFNLSGEPWRVIL